MPRRALRTTIVALSALLFACTSPSVEAASRKVSPTTGAIAQPAKSQPKTGAASAVAPAAKDPNTGGPVDGECPKPVPLMDSDDNSENLDQRFASDWGRFTYPTDQMPAGDWIRRAADHIDRLVPEIPPKGLSTFPALSEKAGFEADAVIPVATTWTEMGPKPLDSDGTSSGYRYGIVSGRVNAIAFQPGSPTTAYIGGVIGGVWKTTNCCSAATNWTPLWDGTTFSAQSVGAIAVDPANTSVVYAGTGDSQVPHFDMYGNGIFRSTDAGATWTQYGAGIMSPYSSPGAPGAACCALATDENIKVIAIDLNSPLDPTTGAHKTVIAGASFGVFISYDTGLTWTQYGVTNRNLAPYTDSAQRVTGLLIDEKTNPSTMYVAIGYPYVNTRSTRLGLTGGANGIWKALVPASGAPAFTLMNNGWPAGTGSGTANAVGRIEIDWDSTHTHIYAHVADYSAASIGATVGIYHSSNGGTNRSVSQVSTSSSTGRPAWAAAMRSR